MMKSKLFVLLAAILVATLVLGCAAPAPEAPAPAPAPSPDKPAPAPSPDKPTPSQLEQIIAKAKEEGEVVVAGSHGDEVQRELPGFYEKYPFITVKGMDLNTAKTVNRVAMEVKAGRVGVDIFETSDDGGFTLAGLGMLQKPQMPYPQLKKFDPRLQPSSGLFVALTLTPRVQGAYNTEMIPPDEVPTNWEMMGDIKWKGQTIQSSSGEEMPLRLAYLWRKGNELDWDRSFDLFGKLFAQEPVITQGYRRGGEQISAGERAIFWFPAPGPIPRMAFQGAPVSFIAFPPNIAGYRTVGIIKGAPHPNAAWLFIDYMTDVQGQHEYAEMSGVLPLNPDTEYGRVINFMIDAGATFENAEASKPGYTLDGMAELVYTPENSKKSEDWFLEMMGVR
jgi:iron(III) transport system substrate-binding protein